MNITVKNVERVTTSLYRFNKDVQARLNKLVAATLDRIATRERASLGAHTKTGDQVASVRVKVKAYGDRGVAGWVIVGGGRKVKYGRVFERGIDTTLQIPAHKSTSRKGKTFSVKAYSLHYKRAPHEYLLNALKSEAPRFNSDVAQVVATTAGEV